MRPRLVPCTRLLRNGRVRNAREGAPVEMGIRSDFRTCPANRTLRDQVHDGEEKERLVRRTITGKSGIAVPAFVGS